MQGPAAIWFDKNITRKNFKLANMNKNLNQAGGNTTLNRLQFLNVQQGAAGGMAAGTYKAGLAAALYSENVANSAVTIGNAFIYSLDNKVSALWKRNGGEGVNDAPQILHWVMVIL